MHKINSQLIFLRIFSTLFLLNWTPWFELKAADRSCTVDAPWVADFPCIQEEPGADLSCILKGSGADVVGPRNLSQPAAALAAILAGEFGLLLSLPSSPFHPSSILLLSCFSPWIPFHTVPIPLLEESALRLKLEEMIIY